MENYLNENFDVKAKNSSEEALERWRKLCGFVKNRKRRFRFTANLSKRFEAEAIRRSNQEKFRVAVLVSQAALQFIHGLSLPSDYTVPEEVKAAGFQICADEVGSIVEGRDVKKLKSHGGVETITDKLGTSSINGISTSEKMLHKRKEIYGVNKFAEKPSHGFLVYVWEALQDTTLMILAFCAFVSLLVGIMTEGWPKGAHDGLGIVASILLVVFVTATSDYKQSLQFKDLEKEKKKITVQVTRDGFRQKLSIYELLPGDIVHLSIGDLVPADGLFVSGFSVLINESSLTGESEPVKVNSTNPFLLSGTKVQDGSCKMLVTTVGMRTQWGKLMTTLTEGGDDETPLQVKLNGVATIIGKIGLFFAVVTFSVLVQGLFSRKLQEGSHLIWSGDDALAILEYFAIAVTIVVVAVPEGLPLAVTLSLAFAMKKMMNDKALVRHLAACETMGSATTICSDKTGTLTTNHMTVVKACICGKIRDVGTSEEASNLASIVPGSGLRLILQSIFNNTGGEVVKNKDGKIELLGTPTETAILEFGMLLGGDCKAEREASKVVKIEPFNSHKKRMGVVLELPEGGFRVHSKGASEIILAACDKFMGPDGEVVPLDKASIDLLSGIIQRFASEALRTLCLAYMEVGNEFSAESPIPASGYTCIGIVGIKDPVRPGVKESVAICRSAGITVRMVTGDNINTAKAGAGQWAPDETRELIAIRGELEIRDSVVSKRSKPQWEAVSSKMTERGFNRTPEQCKCKWKNLLIRYKGKETSDPESGRECPFFEELHAVFTERAKNMQRLLLESEAGSARPKKLVKRKSRSGQWSDELSEDAEEEDSNGKGKKRKGEGVVLARATNAASGSSTSSVQELLKEFFQHQQRMEMEWRQMMETRALERRLFEEEWRQKMEKTERERLMVEQAWREREEERRIREESRAERRDALLTTLLNRLINQNNF